MISILLQRISQCSKTFTRIAAVCISIQVDNKLVVMLSRCWGLLLFCTNLNVLPILSREYAKRRTRFSIQWQICKCFLDNHSDVDFVFISDNA